MSGNNRNFGVGRTSNGSGMIKLGTNKIIYKKIKDRKSAFHYLHRNFLLEIRVSGDSFIIEIFFQSVLQYECSQTAQVLMKFVA